MLAILSTPSNFRFSRMDTLAKSAMCVPATISVRIFVSLNVALSVGWAVEQGTERNAGQRSWCRPSGSTWVALGDGRTANSKLYCRVKCRASLRNKIACPAPAAAWSENLLPRLPLNARASRVLSHVDISSNPHKPESFRGMAETSDTNREGLNLRNVGAAMTAPDVDAWFVREVLPLEAALLQFLRRSRRNKSDVEDLCHDVYVRIYEAAQREIPNPVRPFVFAVARNLLLNRARHENVVAIEAVADLESLGVALDEPGPDRNVIARQELHRLQVALDRLPPRIREVVVMRKIEGLSRPEIAARLGIAQSTISEYLANGMDVLTDIMLGEAGDAEAKP